MSLVINTNIASLNAQRNLSTSQSSLQTSLQRLSSGLRITALQPILAGNGVGKCRAHSKRNQPSEGRLHGDAHDVSQFLGHLVSQRISRSF